MKRKPVRFSSFDTAMCVDYKCPSRNFCLRFSVDKAEKWQVYGDFGRKPDAQKCDKFIGEVVP